MRVGKGLTFEGACEMLDVEGGVSFSSVHSESWSRNEEGPASVMSSSMKSETQQKCSDLIFGFF